MLVRSRLGAPFPAIQAQLGKAKASRPWVVVDVDMDEQRIDYPTGFFTEDVGSPSFWALMTVYVAPMSVDEFRVSSS